MPIVTEKLATMLLLLSLQSPGYAGGIEAGVRPLNRASWPVTVKQSMAVIDKSMTKIGTHFKGSDKKNVNISVRNLVVAISAIKRLPRPDKSSKANYSKAKVTAIQLSGQLHEI